jgi:hypothetical protein
VLAGEDLAARPGRVDEPRATEAPVAGNVRVWDSRFVSGALLEAQEPSLVSVSTEELMRGARGA